MRFPFYRQPTGGRYPYTNFNNVNLDWMLKQLKKIDDIAEIDTELLKEAAAAAQAATVAAQAASAAATTATAAARAATETAQNAAENSVSYSEEQDKTAAEKELARRNSGQHAINEYYDALIAAINGTASRAATAAAAAQADADRALTTAAAAQSDASAALTSVDRSADLTITVDNALNSSTFSTVGSIGILYLSVNITEAIPANTWTTVGQLPAGVVPVAVTVAVASDVDAV